jgi:hypothetical protein
VFSVVVTGGVTVVVVPPSTSILRQLVAKAPTAAIRKNTFFIMKFLKRFCFD